MNYQRYQDFLMMHLFSSKVKACILAWNLSHCPVVHSPILPFLGLQFNTVSQNSIVLAKSWIFVAEQPSSNTNNSLIKNKSWKWNRWNFFVFSKFRKQKVKTGHKLLNRDSLEILCRKYRLQCKFNLSPCFCACMPSRRNAENISPEPNNEDTQLWNLGRKFSDQNKMCTVEHIGAK